MNNSVSNVAMTGIVTDWVQLRTEILSILSSPSSASPEPTVSPDDVSPASTVQLDYFLRRGSHQHILRERILSLDTEPICVQRLCELMASFSPNDPKIYMNLERVLSTSRQVRWMHRDLLRRRSSRSDDSGASYSPSPQRVLKRTRIVFNT